MVAKREDVSDDEASSAMVDNFGLRAPGMKSC